MPKRQLEGPFPPASLAGIGPGWFAVFTNPRYEKKVESLLLQRGVPAYLPTYASTRTWKNRQTVTCRFPLFPNYLFAQIEPQQRVDVLRVAGVLKIVGDRSGLTVDGQYIDVLRKGLKLRIIEPYNETALGDRVRIVSGPMTGVQGILTQVRSEYRVVVSIALIRQSISIEVSRDEIEVLRARHSPEVSTHDR